MTTAEQYKKYIMVTLAVTVSDGIFVGYRLNEERNDLLFVPLLVGFVLVFTLYFFIEKRANMLAEEEKSPRY